MSKRFFPAACVALASLAVVGVAGAGAYYAINQGNLANGQKSGGSSAAASSSSAQPETVQGNGMAIKLPRGPLFASSLGSTLSLSATLSPSNVTDKTIVWSVSSSSVTLSASTTQSGGSVTATLVTAFTGAVVVTAKSESEANVSGTVSLYCVNGAQFTHARPYSIDMATTAAEALNGSSLISSGVGWTAARTISSNYPSYHSATMTPGTGDACASFTATSKASGVYLGVGYYMMGTDVSRLPDLGSTWGVTTSWGDVTAKFDAGDSTITYKVWAKQESFTSGDVSGVMLLVKFVSEITTSSESFDVTGASGAFSFAGSYETYVAASGMATTGGGTFN